MSGGSSQQTQQAQLDPEIKAAYLANLKRATDVAEKLAPRTIAPFTESFETARSGIGSARAGQESTSDFAAMRAREASMYTPERVAAERVAKTLANRAAVRDVGATGGYDLMSQYQNPYEAQVVQGALGDIERQRQIAQQAQQAKAVGARAFGGSRQAVAEALANEDYTRQAANTAAQLRSQGFTTAANLAQQDAARQLQANLANQGVDISIEQANAQIANQVAQFNAQQFLQAGMANQSAGLQANAQKIAAAQALAGMGQQDFSQRMAQAQAQTGFAQMEQAQRQAELDAARNAEIERQQFINQALGLQPGGGAGTISSGSSSSRQGILGLLGL